MMRKDIFVVGARLLGIWQLVGTANSLATLIGTWLGYMRQMTGMIQMNAGLQTAGLHFIVELAAGLFLLFRTHDLFHLLDRLNPEEESAKPAGTE